MISDEFINQGGDPFLDALYRTFGTARVCRSVKIRNGIGKLYKPIKMHCDFNKPNLHI